MQAIERMDAWADMESGLALTNHAWCRMTARGLSQRAVDAVLMFGRMVYARGAEIHAIGKKEVAKYARTGVDLRPYEGLQVVCVPNDGIIMTVYRNRDFRSISRSKPHRRW